MRLLPGARQGATVVGSAGCSGKVRLLRMDQRYTPMRRLVRRLSRARSGCSVSGRGSVLVLTAAAMVPLLGMVSLSVDVGRLMSTRRQLQNAADAAALAGAQRLPDYGNQ